MADIANLLLGWVLEGKAGAMSAAV